MQLTTAFKEGGLRDRSGTYLYKDHIHKSNVPILALAGDQDLICPPEAVEGKLISEMIYNLLIVSMLTDENILMDQKLLR